jgi:hypothetical protein
MKPFGQIILLSLITINCCAQINRDTIKTEGYFAGTKATFEIGINNPIGNLSRILSTNLMFGFSIDIPSTNALRKFIGFNGNIFLTEKSHNFIYKLKDSIINTKIIKTGFIGGIHYTGRTYIKEKYILDKIIGVGLGLLSTDIEKKNNDNKNDKYYSIMTMNFNTGISLKRAISKNTRLGLKLMYNFTPYSLFSKEIPDNFGMHSLFSSIGITF